MSLPIDQLTTKTKTIFFNEINFLLDNLTRAYENTVTVGDMNVDFFREEKRFH